MDVMSVSLEVLAERVANLDSQVAALRAENKEAHQRLQASVDAQNHRVDDLEKFVERQKERSRLTNIGLGAGQLILSTIAAWLGMRK